MNIKRGLFRLWLILSVIFAGLVFLISWHSMMAEFHRADLAGAMANDIQLVPTLCGDARGTPNVDYSRLTVVGQNPFNTCWLDLPKFRKLYPEYANLSDDLLSDKLYDAMNIPYTRVIPPHPWDNLARIVAVAFGFPLAGLLLGSAFLWAFSGFSGRQRTS